MAPGEDATWGHRPHLDGLRAVAVYLVVVFHAGVGRASGGFIGVDVFFVLSGYLVTTLIVRARAAGSFRLLGFYSRRVRRLLPAALVNLAVTAVVMGAILSPAEAASAGRSIRAAALYVSNWYFIGQSTDYFGTDIDASPVLQYWSLSVEEQFYLLWPVLLLGIYALARQVGRRQVQVVRAVVVGAGLASLVAALLLARTQPTRAYMGSDTRAYQLLAGAALALTPGVVARLRRRPGVARALPWVSLGLLGLLVLLATSYVEVGPVTRGVATTAVAVSLLASLEASTGGLGRKLLSRPSMVYLGQVSYGTYLWHWLVLLVIADAYDPSPLVAAAIAVPVATAIASLSYHLLEVPIRSDTRLNRVPGPVVACGIAASVLVGVLVAPQLLEPSGRDADTAALTATGGGTPNRVDWQAARDANTEVFQRDTCLIQRGRACQLATGRGPTIAVIGDSHAAVLAPMVADLAERHDASVWRMSLAGCPWTSGLRAVDASPGCFDWQAATFDEVVPEVDPDLVFLVDRAVEDGEDLVDRDEGPLDGGSERQRARAAQRIGEVVDGLRADGRKVVVIEPIPDPPDRFDPLNCLSTAEFVEACRFVVPTAPSAEERSIRSIADADPGVWSLSMDQLVCPYLPICDPVVNGVVVRADDNHLMVAFARTSPIPSTGSSSTTRSWSDRPHKESDLSLLKFVGTIGR